MTPFDKVRSQLIVKIKEIYLPEAYNAAPSNINNLDFTGGPTNTFVVGASNSTVASNTGYSKESTGFVGQSSALDFT